MNLDLESRSNPAYLRKRDCVDIDMTMIHRFRWSAEYRIPKTDRPVNGFPAVVIVPGIGGQFGDELPNTMADFLARHGFVTCNFDFKSIDFESPGGNIYSANYALMSTKHLLETDPNRVGLVASSFGGGIALYLGNRAKAIITLGALADPYLWHQLPYMKKRAILEDPGSGGLTGIRLGRRKRRIGFDFTLSDRSPYHDIPIVREELIKIGLMPKGSNGIDGKLIESVHRQTTTPVCLIHADESANDVVPAEQSRQLAATIPRTKLVILPRPEDLEARQVHNFEGPLRQPMLDLVLEACTNLVAQDNPAWLQK